MPFTFSHPALVLPLLNRRRRVFSTTGLIIGSITPDFESFIRFDEHKLYSHTWLGIFWFDLPLAVIIAFLFHNVVRDPLVRNLPDFLYYKFVKVTGFNWNRFFGQHLLVVITSMIIGITTHLLWDAFTHMNLSNPDINATKIVIFNTYLHSLLQDLSSIIGLIIVAWYVIRMPDQSIHEKMSPARPSIKAKIQFWLMIAVINLLTVVVVTSIIPKPINIILRIDIIISGFLLGLLLSCDGQKAIKFS